MDVIVNLIACIIAGVVGPIVIWQGQQMLAIQQKLFNQVIRKLQMSEGVTRIGIDDGP
jgi:hypothetical protein